MEGEVYQDEQRGKCQADRGKCLLERQILRRRNRHKDSKATRKVEQREYRERGAQRRSEVGVQEYRQDREDPEREK